MTAKKFKNISFHKPSGQHLAYYYVSLPNGKTRRQGVYGKTEEEADEKRTKILKTIQATSTPRLTSKTSVRAFLYDWLKNLDVKESTRRGYEITIRLHICPRLGKMRLSELDARSVQWAMDEIVKNGGSNNTTRIAKVILSGALKKAEIDYLVMPNIVSHVKLGKCQHKKKALMSLNEIQSFFSLISGNKYELFFLLYALYGLRRGEAIPLKWSDIDFEQKVIHIERQYSKNGMKLEVHSPKSENSCRELPLTPVLEKCLQNIKRNHQDDDYIILDEYGNLPTPYKVDWQFQCIKKRLGREDICLHSLRSSVATMLKDLNIPLKDAQEILGHSTPVITMQYYQQTTIDNKRSAINTLSQSLGVI